MKTASEVELALVHVVREWSRTDLTPAQKQCLLGMVNALKWSLGRGCLVIDSLLSGDVCTPGGSNN